MLQTASSSESQAGRKLSVGLASSAGQVREAQRLRYRVFVEEMGARLNTPEAGLDVDIFDAWCDHLLVRDEISNEVVGTYRILPPHQAKRIGSLYSESEFDLTRLANLRQRMVEVGRSCVHPDYRNGGTITLLWAGLAEYMLKNGYDYLIGCASISMADGGHAAASIYRQASARHLGPIEWRVFPRCPLPLAALEQQDLEAALPPLIKGYLRIGAYVCGEPAWDPDFNTADLLLLLPLARMNPRYMKHFIGAIAA
ncbi:MAG: GNAT family N-acyltransferase [Chitinivorax sp.]